MFYIREVANNKIFIDFRDVSHYEYRGDSGQVAGAALYNGNIDRFDKYICVNLKTNGYYILLDLDAEDFMFEFDKYLTSLKE